MASLRSDELYALSLSLSLRLVRPSSFSPSLYSSDSVAMSSSEAFM